MQTEQPNPFDDYLNKRFQQFWEVELGSKFDFDTIWEFIFKVGIDLENFFHNSIGIFEDLYPNQLSKSEYEIIYIIAERIVYQMDTYSLGIDYIKGATRFTQVISPDILFNNLSSSHDEWKSLFWYIFKGDDMLNYELKFLADYNTKLSFYHHAEELWNSVQDHLNNGYDFDFIKHKNIRVKKILNENEIGGSFFYANPIRLKELYDIIIGKSIDIETTEEQFISHFTGKIVSPPIKILLPHGLMLEVIEILKPLLNPNLYSRKNKWIAGHFIFGDNNGKYKMKPSNTIGGIKRNNLKDSFIPNKIKKFVDSFEI